ncbi:hypothetical protein LTR50_004356 [Elasticomyces elasticus]|nr:hypothetical protein LTR50_004356 [Elasticomyces elasticus]
MVLGPSIEALQELQNPTSLDAQIAALRRIKNDIVGHEQRKELVVRHGIIIPLAKILSGPRLSESKHNADIRAADDELRSQALLVVGSLANGGPPFLDPILSGELLQLLIAHVSPEDTPPHITTEALRAIAALGKGWASLRDAASTTSSFSKHPFTEMLYSSASVEKLATVLRTTAEYRQLCSVTELIATTCREQPYRGALIKVGVLDLLTSHLISFAVSAGHVRLVEGMDLPLSPTITDMPTVLDAISAIVQGSKYRVHRLIYSTPVVKAFASTVDLVGPFGQAASLRENPSLAYDSSSALGHLLPKLQTPQHKSVSFSQSFPTFGNAHGVGHADSVWGFSGAASAAPLTVWLLHLARSNTGSLRLAALRLLAVVNAAISGCAGDYKAEASEKARERHLAYLAVPLAVRTVEEASAVDTSTLIHPYKPSETRVVKERACATLGILIKDSVDLQKAAVDAGAIRKVCLLLKKSFDPIPTARPMWNPKNIVPESLPSQPSTTLGPAGLSVELAHVMECRQGALEALAALAHKEDSHRKAIVDAGVMPSIVDSLKPFPDSSINTPRSALGPRDGSTVAVLLAACYAATSMSRSVSLLRTSLIDAGVAKPVFALLKHDDGDVAVAATNVLCNLLLEFSAMRQDLMAADVMKILCDHAKWSDTRLRLSSLWALKHLVYTAPKSIKILCLEEIGTGWLIQTVNCDHDAANSTLGMGTPNAAGEQVDLLNTPESTMDVDPYSESDDEEDGNVMTDIDNGPVTRASQLRSTLKPTNYRAHLRTIWESEQNPRIHARRDDLQIQEQALDFIRNLINGDDNEAMIQHLNEILGASRLFDMLHRKLRPTIIANQAASNGNNSSRRFSPASSSASQRWTEIYQPPEIILSTIHIIAHLAAGPPAYKQLFIAQHALIKAWAQHFNHASARIRVQCVYGVISLTWIENQEDRPDAMRRAQELRVAGIEDKVRALSGDSDIDIREKVKMAVSQFDDLLGVR